MLSIEPPAIPEFETLPTDTLLVSGVSVGILRIDTLYIVNGNKSTVDSMADGSSSSGKILTAYDRGRGTPEAFAESRDASFP
jgi:hypothetical protein